MEKFRTVWEIYDGHRQRRGSNRGVFLILLLAFTAGWLKGLLSDLLDCAFVKLVFLLLTIDWVLHSIYG